MRQFDYSSHDWFQLSALTHRITLLRNIHLLHIQYSGYSFVISSWYWADMWFYIPNISDSICLIQWWFPPLERQGGWASCRQSTISPRCYTNSWQNGFMVSIFGKIRRTQAMGILSSWVFEAMILAIIIIRIPSFKLKIHWMAHHATSNYFF